MSCAATMTTAGLVAMRSSCPRNPPGGQTTGSKRKTAKEGYGPEVLKPGPHDVLLGRGGGTNNHSGNINFRKLVNEHKMRYLACSKIEKPNVAREVVELWKKLDPPGRFLTRKEEGKRKDENDQVVWIEVPEKKAREKASQCLRERTPDVVPYIRQLREQQDQMTEQGVSMVQQQLKMQREAESQKNSLNGMAAAAANYSRRNSLAEHNPYQGGVAAGANNNDGITPMTAMSNGGAADFSGRRGSMPMMQGASELELLQQQQEQQAAFQRRLSAPHMMSGSNHGAMPANASSMMEQMNNMNQFGGGGMMEPGFVGSGGGCGDMYDPAFASSMTAMQLQQHHQQQLHLQQLQQQQQMLQHQMQMQHQQMAQANMGMGMGMGMGMEAGHMGNMRNARGMMGGAMDAPGHWNMGMDAQAAAMSHSGHGGPNVNGLHNNSAHSQSQRLLNNNSMKDNSSSRHSNNSKSRAPDAPKSRQQVCPPAHLMNQSRPVPKPDESKSSGNNNGGSSTHIPRDASPTTPRAKPAAATKKKGGKKQKKQQPPAIKLNTTKADTTPQAASRPEAATQNVVTPIDPPAGHEFDSPFGLNADGGDEEVGIEEYRKTLESYMVNNNMTTQTPVYYSDEDDLSVESFPAWPDEGDHPERDDAAPKRRGRAAPDSRKVDRRKSNQSMMSVKSVKSNKSNMTSLSGLSMLSDMMSMESGKLSREDKMGDSKRFSSNASIMSELTDISATIDGLGLDDDM